jgi:hypothetical protein
VSANLEPRIEDFSRVGQIVHCMEMLALIRTFKAKDLYILLGEMDWLEELHRLIHENT